MLRLTLALLLVASSSLARTQAADPDPANLARSLARHLQGRTVVLADGARAWVLEPAQTRAEPSRRATLLTAERLEACLRTVGEAGAWPAAWLVVQQQGSTVDLVMRLELATDGDIAAPEFVFAVPTREWRAGEMKRIAHEATGRRPPRRGLENVVLQSFSTRLETTYVYERPDGVDAKRGLAALLPDGALVREARAVELGDGRRYTLALVLRDAVFVPGDCGRCPTSVFGHADSGVVTLVLAGESELIAQLDLTAALHGRDGRPLVPRFPCTVDAVDDAGIRELHATVEPMTLLELVDLDGDGRRLELELPAAQRNCGRHVTVGARIRLDGSGLDLVEATSVLPLGS